MVKSNCQARKRDRSVTGSGVPADAYVVKHIAGVMIGLKAFTIVDLLATPSTIRTHEPGHVMRSDELLHLTIEALLVGLVYILSDRL